MLVGNCWEKPRMWRKLCSIWLEMGLIGWKVHARKQEKTWEYDNKVGLNSRFVLIFPHLSHLSHLLTEMTKY